MKKKLLVMLIAALLAVPATVFAVAGVLDDEVTSIKLKEADNSGSQDTNSGSGVKTGHIQNDAVTSAKIAIGAITTVKIADGAVTGSAIADGAVTDAKITGTISTTKLDVGTAVGTVAAGDHNHDAIYQKKYAKVAVVAQAGGDYIDPVAAMNNYSAWCGAGSAENRCLIKIMPGIYGVPGGLMVPPSHVDIEGSGPDNTIIRGTGSYAYLVAAGGSSFRNITFESEEYVSEMFRFFGTEQTLDNVKIVAHLGGTEIRMYSGKLRLNNVEMIFDGGNNATGILSNYDSAEIVLDNTKITANTQQFTGLYVSGSATLKNVEINYIAQISTSYYGIQTSGTVKIYNSVLASPASIAGDSVNAGAGAEVSIVSSQIQSSIYANGATLKIVNSYDRDFNPILNQ